MIVLSFPSENTAMPKTKTPKKAKPKYEAVLKLPRLLKGGMRSTGQVVQLTRMFEVVEEARS